LAENRASYSQFVVLVLIRSWPLQGRQVLYVGWGKRGFVEPSWVR